jgi:hypothetical protein
MQECEPQFLEGGVGPHHCTVVNAQLVEGDIPVCGRVQRKSIGGQYICMIKSTVLVEGKMEVLRMQRIQKVSADALL